MNRSEFEALAISEEIPKVLDISSLENQGQRTLMIGMDDNEIVRHVYLKNWKINIVRYREQDETPISHYEASEALMSELIPLRSAIPSASDYELSRLLADAGFKIPYSDYADAEEQIFSGKTTESFLPTEQKISELGVAAEAVLRQLSVLVKENRTTGKDAEDPIGLQQIENDMTAVSEPFNRAVARAKQDSWARWTPHHANIYKNVRRNMFYKAERFQKYHAFDVAINRFEGLLHALGFSPSTADAR